MKQEKSNNPHVKFFHVKFNLQERPELLSILDSITGVESVEGRLGEFIHKYHFSISKGELFEWEEIEKEIREVINNYLVESKPYINEPRPNPTPPKQKRP